MAEEKIFRVAVIGRTGRGGYGHQLDTAFLSVPATRIVAVADEDPRGLAAAARRLGVDRTYSDYRKMLDEVPCDIVAICPRWVDQHHAMAMAAAEHGRHMYIEKPFCRTLREADEIVAACERAHLKLAVAHPTRYSPKLDTVRRLIRQGVIGRVLESIEMADPELVAVRRQLFTGISNPHHYEAALEVPEHVHPDTLRMTAPDVAERHAADWRALLRLDVPMHRVPPVEDAPAAPLPGDTGDDPSA